MGMEIPPQSSGRVSGGCPLAALLSAPMEQAAWVWGRKPFWPP